MLAPTFNQKSLIRARKSCPNAAIICSKVRSSLGHRCRSGKISNEGVLIHTDLKSWVAASAALTPGAFIFQISKRAEDLHVIALGEV